MNIVFGGTFNPPTIAHENAIKKVLETLDVERLIMVPVGGKYHLKQVDLNEHRFAMCKLVADKLGVEVSRLELDSEKYKGTYHLLKSMDLKDSKFLIGSDNLEQLDKWIDPEKILNEFGLVVLNRGTDLNEIIDSSKLLKKYKQNIVVIEDFDEDVSSTMFRTDLDFDLVSEEVKQYIIENDLYGGNHVS